MAQRTTINTNKGSRGSGTIVVVSDVTGFLSTSANANTTNQAQATGETISSWSVADIVWSGGATTTSWTLSRGSDTVFVAYGQNGHIDFTENQIRLETPTQATANLVFTLSGTGNIVIKMHKQSGE